MKAIYGQDVAPGFADRYLAKNGFDAQQTDEPVSPDRPDNLFEPVEGDYAAHGIFTQQAKKFSPQNWANLHRASIGIASVGIAALGLTAMLRKR